MIILSGHISVPESELAKIREALPKHIAATRAEAGCVVFNVQENETEIGRFEVYEEFTDKKAFQCHQERVRQSDWGAVTKNVIRHYTVTGLED